jgi:hypothetical protein
MERLQAAMTRRPVRVGPAPTLTVGTYFPAS